MGTSTSWLPGRTVTTREVLFPVAVPVVKSRI
jgi:hypothetical protein